MLSFDPHPSARHPHRRPTADKSRPNDLTTLDEFAAFMDATDRSFTVRTYQRWVKEERLQTWPDPADSRGRRQLVSRTDLLELHRRHQDD